MPVVRHGLELSSDVLDRAFVVEVVETIRELRRSGVDVGTVVCGKRSAYVERVDREFLDQAEQYYALLEHVPDVLRDHQVVVSEAHWVDVMTAHTHKGSAVKHLQEMLGIAPAQTLAFGDYLNDLEMLDAADHSYAMANAHPDVLARARFVAPSNTDNGVVTTIAALLDIDLGL